MVQADYPLLLLTIFLSLTLPLRRMGGQPLLLYCLLCCCHLPLQAAPARQILTVIEPPASYLDSHGNLTGYAAAQVKALQQQMRDSHKIQLVPESRALLIASRQPHVLLFGFSRTAEREAHYHWIMPLLRKRWMVYVRHDSKLQPDSLAALRSLESIGVVRGDVREEWLKSQGFTNLQPSSSHAQNLARLYSGRLEAIVYEPQGMKYLIQETALPADAFRPVLQVQTSEVWLLMSGSTPAGEAALWQQAAEQLKQSGELEKISRHWQQQLRLRHGIDSELQQQLLLF